jgi:hypothetical protein
MTQDTAKTPAIAAATTEQKRHSEQYRSIADGELVTTWTLPEYFGSLNTVMRLPSKVRRKAEQVAQRTPGGVTLLALVERIRIPKGLVMAAAAVAVIVLVIRPLVLSASGSGTAQLPQTYGVWQATEGRYKGRTFEVSETDLIFRTSSKAAEFTRHKIASVQAKTFPDSTRFTVTYQSDETDAKTAEFAFWYVPGPKPVIRFVNQREVNWTRVK